MTHRTFGILAHVDAGKTTLSEALLYLTGQIRSAGRVDRGDTHLDTSQIEKDRGITIFSKQARIRIAAGPEEDPGGGGKAAGPENDPGGSGKAAGPLEMILLDTPGHVDFSAETERVLQVLDCAVLVISGTDGVQSHTRTLWRLLAHYDVPVLIFVNKMDLAGADHGRVMENLKNELSADCIDFTAPRGIYTEEAATSDEKLLDVFMEEGDLPDELIRDAAAQRKLFPVWFGSALKMENLEGLLHGLRTYTKTKEFHPGQNKYGYAAVIYKTGRDSAGARLTYLRVTKGMLTGRMQVTYRAADGNERTEKIDQIRLYSGDQYEQVKEAPEGQVCAVTGLTVTLPGMGLGDETHINTAVIEPVIRRSLILPPDVNPMSFYRKILPLAEEDPMLHIAWNEKNRCIDLQIMGEVQVEVLTRIMEERFGVRAEAGEGSIIYKETVTKAVEGVGHFEPLRHYAEVHLLLEPGGTGSGVTVATAVSQDDLDLNWQRLILTHILETEHPGVLTGSALTDVKITLIAGRAHLKHTEGGDFRQATYRAIRQGLMMTESAVLEPYYSFILTVPHENLGRAMSDLGAMCADFGEPEFESGGARAVLRGSVPVAAAAAYQAEVSSYTRGEGSIALTLLGYRPCHNPEEVIGRISYDPDSDTEHPSSSVFCAHGAGFIVPWYEVPGYAHLPCTFDAEMSPPADEFPEFPEGGYRIQKGSGGNAPSDTVSPEEDADLKSIYEREFGGTGGKRGGSRHRYAKKTQNEDKKPEFRQKYDKHGAPIYPKKDAREEHLIVDGYNIIFQWEELNSLASADIAAARGKLLDLLSNYQGYLGYPVTVVFDAYRTGRNPASVNRWQNLTVVFTKENETADAYIEKKVHDESGKYRFTVATSDGMEQLTVLRLGALRMSARILREDMARMSQWGQSPLTH